MRGRQPQSVTVIETVGACRGRGGVSVWSELGAWGHLSAGRIEGGVGNGVTMKGQSPVTPVSAACPAENQTTAAKKWRAVAPLQSETAKKRSLHSMYKC